MELERKVHLYCYKTGNQIMSTDQLPVLADQRTSTDVFCTVLTSIFAIAMFITALVTLNMSALQKMTYPTDSQGRHCTLDNNNFNFLYFPTPNNPTKRLCLAKCPTGSESRLDCWPTNQISCSANSNPQYQVTIYATDQVQTSMGLFCLPTDKAVKQNLLTKANLQNMFNFAANYNSIGISLLSGLGLGILAIVLFSFIPTMTTYTSIALGGLGCFVLATLLLISNSNVLGVYKAFVIIFSLALIAVGFLLLWGLCFRQAEINLSIFYIKQASKCIWQAPVFILLSFVFLALLVGLIALCTFQVFAYWSSSEMVLNSDSIYLQPKGSFATTMTVFTAIQFFWGLCFLKQALNFIVSGIAISWNFDGEHSILFPIANLFRYHWGSVAGGAFLLNILYPLDIVYDLIKPNQMSPKTISSSICCCCQRILDLARSQAMAMISLLGAPYCNSARLCQQIVFYSSKTDGGESANRFVRIGSHILFAGLATLFGWIYAQSNGTTSVIAVTLCFVINLFNLTFFVCLIKDIAQALLFCDLVENCLKNEEQIQSVMPASKKLFGEGYEILRTEHYSK